MSPATHLCVIYLLIVQANVSFEGGCGYSSQRGYVYKKDSMPFVLSCCFCSTQRDAFEAKGYNPVSSWFSQVRSWMSSELAVIKFEGLSELGQSRWLTLDVLFSRRDCLTLPVDCVATRKASMTRAKGDTYSAQ